VGGMQQPCPGTRMRALGDDFEVGFVVRQR
jgi:hypothetical protein